MDGSIRARLEPLASRLHNVTWTTSGISAVCPVPGVHDSGQAKLTATANPDGRILVTCHSARCKVESIVGAVGMTLADLAPTDGRAAKKRPTKPKIVATYDYRNESGTLLYQAARFHPKDFSQRRPDPANAGQWIWSLGDVRRVLYRLPELLADPTADVIIPEGEKDVETARRLGFAGTCGAMGAGKWRSEYVEHLRGRRVLVIADADDKGRPHAQAVARSLHGVASDVRVVEMPSPHKDLSDWVLAGGTASQLRAMWDAATVWTPSSSSPAQPITPHVTGSEEPGGPVIPPWRPMPIDLLPPVVERYVTESAAAQGNIEPAMITVPALALIAGAIGNSRRAKIKSTWCEPSVIWSVVVAPPSTGKSPALDAAKRPLAVIHDRRMRQHAELVRQHARDMACHEADMATWKKSGRKVGEPPPDCPDEPRSGQFLANDATVEALVPMLVAHPRGLIVCRDELSGWVNSFDAYKSSSGVDVATYLSMWSAQSATVNRKTGIRLQHIERAAVSITGTIQPGALRAALGGRSTEEDAPQNEHVEDGLAARLLMTLPPVTPARLTDDVPSAETVDAYARLVDELLAIELRQTEEEGAAPRIEPIDLPLSRGAWSEFRRFHDAQHAEAITLPPALGAAWGKLVAYAARIALIHRLCVDPDAGEISRDDIERGIELARWFGHEATRAYAAIGVATDDQDAAEIRRVDRLAGWIASRGDAVTLRDVTRGPRVYRDDHGLAERDLAALVTSGRITHASAASADAGGRPTVTYRVPVPSPSGDRTTLRGDETPANTGGNEVSSPSPPSPHLKTKNEYPPVLSVI